MVADVEIRPVTSLPDGVESLRAESLGERLDFVDRLVNRWEDGSNRFDRPGEVLLAMWWHGALVGVGGLNVDPYADDPRLGRIRHVYLSPRVRGMGLGERLVSELLSHARGRFDRVRLRVGVPGSEGFYDGLGFSRSEEPNATHDRKL